MREKSIRFRFSKVLNFISNINMSFLKTKKQQQKF